MFPVMVRVARLLCRNEAEQNEMMFETAAVTT